MIIGINSGRKGRGNDRAIDGGYIIDHERTVVRTVEELTLDSAAMLCLIDAAVMCNYKWSY